MIRSNWGWTPTAVLPLFILSSEIVSNCYELSLMSSFGHYLLSTVYIRGPQARRHGLVPGPRRVRKQVTQQEVSE